MGNVVNVTADNITLYRPFLKETEREGDLQGNEMVPVAGTPLILGYETGGMACGALYAICTRSDIVISWISVYEPMRGRGIGSAMLETLCERAEEIGADEVSAVVCLPEKALKSAERLLQLHQFRKTEESPAFRFRLADVQPELKKEKTDAEHSHIVPFSQLSTKQLTAFNQMLTAGNGNLYPPVIMNEILPAQSFAWVEEKRITGCILLANCGKDLELKWLYGNGPAALHGMVAALAVAAARKFPGDTWIHATAAAPDIDRMLRAITGGRMEKENTVSVYSRQIL